MPSNLTILTYATVFAVLQTQTVQNASVSSPISNLTCVFDIADIKLYKMLLPKSYTLLNAHNIHLCDKMI